jgi:phosphoribosylanthranilate isomerase
VKICGLTHREDAELAVALGATDLGCVLVPGTPRHVEPLEAGAILADLDPLIRSVLVFRDPGVDEVLRVVDASGIREVQLHRTPESTAVALEQAGLRVRRALDAPFDPACVKRSSERRLVVLDAAGGGSGRAYDRRLLHGLDLSHAFVAGGLTPENLGRVLALRPLGLDVSSGVEQRPGRKNPARLRSFLDAAKNVSRPLAPSRPGLPS